MTNKLPTKWFWSYIFRPYGDVKLWSACAVSYTGRRKKIGIYEYLPIINEAFATGKTKRKAMSKVIDIIKSRKYNTRAIYFPEE